MGHLRTLVASALPLLAAQGIHAQDPAPAAPGSGKYCSSGEQSVCYSEYAASPSGVLYRIAIPDVAQPPFDVLLQIVAPAKVGWAGIAWGGSLKGSPLAVAYPNGNTVAASSHWANGDDLSAPFTGASYTVLTSSRNKTHWTADLLCAGCSSWDAASLNPTGVNTLLWAVGDKAPTAASAVPASTASGTFAEDLGAARVSSNKFRRYILFLQSGQPVDGPPPPGATSVDGPTALRPTASTIIRPPPPEGGPTGVRTSVTVLPPRPRPTTSVSSFPPTVIGPGGGGRPTSRPTLQPPRPTTTMRTSPRPGGPVTVTVTVTQPPGGGRPTRSTPGPPRPTTSRDPCSGWDPPWWCDDDDDEWWWGDEGEGEGGWGGGGWEGGRGGGGRGGRGGGGRGGRGGGRGGRGGWDEAEGAQQAQA